MRGKLLFITGGLVGYVLGARAGRKRYDQIAATASNLWNRPPVQRRVNEVRDFALERVGDVPSALFAAGKKVASAVQNKVEQSKDDSSATGFNPAQAGGATAASKAAASATKSAKAAAASAKSAKQSADTAGDTPTDTNA